MYANIGLYIFCIWYNSKFTIETEGFEKGLYFVKIGTETQKLVVE